MRQAPDEIEVEEPDFAPWDGRRVPVALLGGYLGSGKTTLLNELLRRTEVPIAVLVNDVGAVNIDSRLIERRASDTLELTGGCVCCSLRGANTGIAPRGCQNREPGVLAASDTVGANVYRPIDCRRTRRRRGCGS